MDVTANKFTGETTSAGQWASRKRHALKFLKKRRIRGLASEAQRAGLKGTFASARRQFHHAMWTFLGARWERKYGVNTSGWVKVTDLEVVGLNGESGTVVVSTPPRLYRFLKQLFPVDWPAFTFVDVGCGKGRVLMLALLQGFRNVVGIEFAPSICALAEQNLDHFKHHVPSQGACSVINADATEVD